MKYGKLTRKNIEMLERLAETPEGVAALTEFVEKQKEARSAYKRYVKIINKKEKTPNEIRAAFIKKCKRYVKDNGNGVEFIVMERETPSGLERKILAKTSGVLASFGISGVGGVYNEYVEKANALAWLKKDYSFVEETEKTPQPHKSVVGSKVVWDNTEYVVIKVENNPLLGVECQEGSLVAEKGVIIDDTNAQYYKEGTK